MLNQVLLVGRIKGEIRTVENEYGDEMNQFDLSVKREYKNEKGEYDEDIIKCIFWKDNMNTTEGIYKNNTLVGIKGELRTGIYNLKIGKNTEELRLNTYTVLVKKITYISS
jgi:single-strand DNA-binding protein